MPDRQRGEDAVIDTRNDADTPPPWRSRRPDQAATPITTQSNCWTVTPQEPPIRLPGLCWAPRRHPLDTNPTGTRL